MIEKTDAVALRVIPYSETSQIVTWLTPGHGRLVTIFKGAQRPKSAHLGQYDLFYTCELLFYTRDRHGLHIGKECAPLRMRNRFRHDWRACAAASYVADIIYRAAFSGAHATELYALVAQTLDFAATHRVKPQLLSWFELQLLAVLGMAPLLTRCAICGTDLPREPRHAILSPAEGGLICPSCPPRQTGATRLNPDVVAMLRSWQAAPSPRHALNTRCTPRQIHQSSHALGLLTDYHLDMTLRSRYIAYDLLAT